jgi:hypothetical protein
VTAEPNSSSKFADEPTQLHDAPTASPRELKKIGG